MLRSHFELTTTNLKIFCRHHCVLNFHSSESFSLAKTFHRETFSDQSIYEYRSFNKYLNRGKSYQKNCIREKIALENSTDSLQMSKQKWYLFLEQHQKNLYYLDLHLINCFADTFIFNVGENYLLEDNSQ